MLRAMPEKQRTKLAKQPASCYAGQVTKAAPVANTGKRMTQPARPAAKVISINDRRHRLIV
jgi:hypothetical protein